MGRNGPWRVCLAVGLLALPVATALAQGAPTPAPATSPIGLPQDLYDASIQALVELGVIAVILEQALALIFDWKPFRETFDRLAVKPIVSFLFALGLVHEFNLDIVADLMKVYGSTAVNVGMISKLVTALVLAGGSGGINRILQRLGFRNDATFKKEVPPPPTMAHVAVVPMPKAPKPDIASVTIIGIDANGTAHSLGTVPGANIGRDPKGLGAWFLQEKGRFPSEGGFPLAPGKWSIRLDATDSAGAVSSSTVWGPYQVDAGTRIDLTLKV